MNKNPGMLGRKIGMTQYFDSNDNVVPCTVVEAGPCAVVQIKTVETDGYNAIQLGFAARPTKDASRQEREIAALREELETIEEDLKEADEDTTARLQEDKAQWERRIIRLEKSAAAHRLGVDQPLHGHFAKAGVSPTRLLREFRLDDVSGYSLGQSLTISDVLKVGQKVDVTGTSKGKGFSGVMKKFHFRGFLRSHGVHEFFRHGGSIGTRLTPGHVQKGMKMPGQLGNARATVQNLQVVKIDAEKNLVYIRGGIPGPNGNLVSVRGTSKGPQ